MQDHTNKEADRLWDKVVEPFLCSNVLPIPGVEKSFISSNEALKYGILGRVALNDGYKLCVEDVLASFVVSFPHRFDHIKMYRFNFFEVACLLVAEVKRCAKQSFLYPTLRGQREIVTERNEQDVLPLFDDYGTAFKRYFSLFNEKPEVVTLRVFFPSKNGTVERDNVELTFDVFLSSENEALDGMFVMGYDYGIVTKDGLHWVVDVVSYKGKNYFATNLGLIDNCPGTHIWGH